MSAIASGIVGLLSLLAGRQLYWVFVGAAGFILAFNLAERFLGTESEVLVLIIGLLAGIAGAVLAVVAQRLAVALAGFVAGGFLLFYVGQLLGLQGDLVEAILFVVGGVLGAILISVLFDPALIILSSLLGASLLTQAAERVIDLSPTLNFVILVVLIVIGLAIQFAIWRPQARARQDSERAT